MLYASMVAYASTIIILYLVNQQALAHSLMITGPLLMLCWVGMKTVILLGRILGGLVAIAEVEKSILLFLHHCIVRMGKRDEEANSEADSDEIWKELGLD